MALARSGSKSGGVLRQVLGLVRAAGGPSAEVAAAPLSSALPSPAAAAASSVGLRALSSLASRLLGEGTGLGKAPRGGLALARCLPRTQVRPHMHHNHNPDGETIKVTFIDKDGDEHDIEAPVGANLLEIAHMNDVELEGACEGSLACSTCHLIVEDEDHYDLMEEPDDDENDMLDLAFGLTETSRLGCQVICKPELDGLRVRIPSATRNMAVDGFVPKPH